MYVWWIPRGQGCATTVLSVRLSDDAFAFEVCSRTHQASSDVGQRQEGFLPEIRVCRDRFGGVVNEPVIRERRGKRCMLQQHVLDFSPTGPFSSATVI